MVTEISNQALLEQLTQKQVEVLDLLLEHKTSKQISRILGISSHTVDQRIEIAKRKLGVSTRNELAKSYQDLKRICHQMTYEESRIDTNRNLAEDSDPGTSDTSSFLLGSQSVEPLAIKEEVISRTVGPVLLDGKNGALLRIIVILGVALGILVVLFATITVYVGLSELVKT